MYIPFALKLPQVFFRRFRLVPKNELKPEQFPKAVVEALRREGHGLQQMGCDQPSMEKK